MFKRHNRIKYYDIIFVKKLSLLCMTRRVVYYIPIFTSHTVAISARKKPKCNKTLQNPLKVELDADKSILIYLYGKTDV